jgi:hypothetical protein
MARRRRSNSIFASKAAAGAMLALALSMGLAAEELSPAFVAEHGDMIVARVVCEGNKRTKDSAIAELTGMTPGMRVSAIDPEAARQSLLKSQIFSEAELSVDIEDGQAVVTVRVKDKWTFLPIPSGYFGSGGWSAGLDLVEFNFLGLRKTLVLGGSDSNLGWSGLVAYSDPRFFGTRLSFRSFADYGSANEAATYMDGSQYAAFVNTTADGGLSLVYPSEGKLQGELDATARHSGVAAGDADQFGLYQDSLALQFAATATYDDRAVVGYRMLGTTASATYEHSIRIEGMPAFDLGSASAETDLPAFWGGSLELGASGRLSSGAFQSLGYLSGPGFRTLPYGSTYSPRDATAYADLALPLIRLGWSTMEFGPFYEAGVYATGLEAGTAEFFHGPGLLYRLYLRDIDLPAIEFAAAYNIPARMPVFSLNIGVTL